MCMRSRWPAATTRAGVYSATITIDFQLPENTELIFKYRKQNKNLNTAGFGQVTVNDEKGETPEKWTFIFYHIHTGSQFV